MKALALGVFANRYNGRRTPRLSLFPKGALMKAFLIAVSKPLIVALDLFALAIVAIGAVEAFVRAMKSLLLRESVHARREIWLRFARWLVAALTFQLGADIIETSITEDWTSIGRIAAVAVIRTALNYFLERDLAETLAKQTADGAQLEANGRERG